MLTIRPLQFTFVCLSILRGSDYHCNIKCSVGLIRPLIVQQLWVSLKDFTRLFMHNWALALSPNINSFLVLCLLFLYIVFFLYFVVFLFISLKRLFPFISAKFRYYYLVEGFLVFKFWPEWAPNSKYWGSYGYFWSCCCSLVLVLLKLCLLFLHDNYVSWF